MGYTESDARAVLEFVATLPLAFLDEGAEFVRLEMKREEVETFYATAKREGSPWYRSIIDRACMDRVEAAVRKDAEAAGEVDKRLFVTTLRVSLTTAKQAELREEWAGVTLLKFPDVSSSFRAEHGMANATRTISTVLLRRFVPRDARVLEVGANPISVVMQGPEKGRYMALLPVLDARDVIRHSPEERAIKLMLARRGASRLKPNQEAVARAYVDDFSSMFSRAKVQDVHFPADVALSVEANYDIPMIDMARAMHRNGIRVWYGSMVRCPRTSVTHGQVSGRVEPIGFNYSIDASKDRITFYFDGTSFSYTHKLSIYRDYQIARTRTFRLGGFQYVYSILPQSVKSQIFFSMTRVADILYEPSPYQYTKVPSGGLIRVTSVQSSGHRGDLRPVVFDVGADMLTKVLQQRLVLGPKANDVEVVRIIRSSRLTVVHNGVRVSVDQPLAIPLIRPFAVCVNVLVRDFYGTGEENVADFVSKLAEADCQPWVRAASGFFRDIVTVLSSPLALIGAVRDRMKSLLELDPNLSFGLEYVPHYERTRVPAVVNVDSVDEAALAVDIPLCEELVIARQTRAGVFGALSVAEESALDRYIALLKRRQCGHCAMPSLVDDLRSGQVLEAVNVVQDDACFESEASGDSSNCGSSTLVESSDGTDASSVAADDGVYYDAVEWGDGDCSSGGDVQVHEQADESDVEEVARVFDEGDASDAVVVSGGFARAATKEYVEVMGLQIEGIESEARNIFRVLGRTGELSEEQLERMGDGRVTHHMVEIRGNVVCRVIGKGMDPHEVNRVFDYKRNVFVDTYTLGKSKARMVPERTSSLVYTNSRFKIWNGPRLMAAAQIVLRSTHYGQMQRFSFVAGVYGCGKTREIKANYTVGRLYLVSSADGAQSVRRDLFGDAPEGKKYVRTYDSALMHGVENFTDVVMDEAPMAHPGQIAALLEFIRPEKVVAYGDFKQIPVISFVAGKKFEYGSLEGRCDMEYRWISHRCRLSVAAAVLPWYGLQSGLGVCRCCSHVLESEEGFFLKKVESLSGVPLLPGVRYLTFTHAEQRELQLALTAASGGQLGEFLSVLTVHEAQGGTWPIVKLVRLVSRAKLGSIYFWPQHVLTALTRGQLETTYYTTSLERDAVVGAYDASRNEAYRDIVRRNSGII